MQTYETLFVIVVAVLAGYYLYRKTVKTGGCGCGRKDCPTKKHKV